MRIIVIERSKKIRIFLRKTFEAACYTVDIAENENKGIFLARTNYYDLVCLNCYQDVESCINMCRKIKTDNSEVSIMVFISKTNAETRVRLYNNGADDCLARGVVVDELLARVKILLKRQTGLVNNIIKVDDLVLDVGRHYVARGGKEVYLTLKEINLLKYLLDNQGKVLSRSQIMDQVWDSNADPFSNTIESHIFSLRKKIDTKGKKKLIYTINGRGYKIDF